MAKRRTHGTVWYEAQKARQRFKRAAARLEKQMANIEDAQESLEMAMKINKLRYQASQSYASVINERAKVAQEETGATIEETTNDLLAALRAESIQTKVSFASASDKEKNETAKALLKRRSVKSSSPFYAATRQIWDKPGVKKEDRDQLIMDYLGVSNLYDAMRKVEEITGLNLTEEDEMSEYERYKMFAKQGQLAIKNY